MKFVPALFIAAFVLSGCSTQNSVQPAAAFTTAPSATIAAPTANVSNLAASAGLKGGGGPSYEPAYYNGSTVTINAIEVPQNAGPLEHAAAEFYQVVYPPNKALWPSNPMCNPCDHQGNGDDITDYHDHLLDSIPSSPGHGEYSPLWHVMLIMPADFSPATQAAYAARLPMKSEAAVDAAIAAGVAQEIDTQFYFICAVVNEHASH
jgi:hypothetical protein